MKQAKVKFNQDVRVTHANKDGTQRYTYFKKDQLVTLSLTSAQYRIQNGQADFVEYVTTDTGQGVPDISHLIINTPRSVVVTETVDVLAVIRDTHKSITELNLARAKSEFKTLTTDAFEDFLADSTVDQDSAMVVSEAIKEISTSGDFGSVRIGDLSGALKMILDNVS